MVYKSGKQVNLMLLQFLEDKTKICKKNRRYKWKGPVRLPPFMKFFLPVKSLENGLSDKIV